MSMDALDLDAQQLARHNARKLAALARIVYDSLHEQALPDEIIHGFMQTYWAKVLDAGIDANQNEAITQFLEKLVEKPDDDDE